jgi:FtsP/CotA-like multicopper oxidase with cupredoxin domain
LGVLGPLLHAEVGDRLRVVFRNRTHRPFSVHPHGVFYEKGSEGAGYADGTTSAMRKDDAVPPGATYTYIWDVPERAGPGPADPSSILWLYHSHVDPARDSWSGLVGGIVVIRAGMARPDGTPKDVDREIFTLFHIFNENESWYLEEGLKAAGIKREIDHKDPDFVESNLRHAINGYTHGNAPGLTMQRCERVRWYVGGLGNEVDLHTAHWHGNTGLLRGSRRDVVDVLPAMTEVLDMQPDNAGRWMLHCHVTDHGEAGMWATYTVTDGSPGASKDKGAANRQCR